MGEPARELALEVALEPTEVPLDGVREGVQGPLRLLLHTNGPDDSGSTDLRVDKLLGLEEVFKSGASGRVRVGCHRRDEEPRELRRELLQLEPPPVRRGVLPSSLCWAALRGAPCRAPYIRSSSALLGTRPSCLADETDPRFREVTAILVAPPVGENS